VSIDIRDAVQNVERFRDYN